MNFLNSASSFRLAGSQYITKTLGSNYYRKDWSILRQLILLKLGKLNIRYKWKIKCWSFKKTFVYGRLFSSKVKLQVMPLQAGQKLLEQIALVPRHLEPHLLQEVSDVHDGMRHLPVKWVAPPRWLVPVAWHQLDLQPCRCRHLPQDRWLWHQSRCRHIAGRGKLMKGTGTFLMMNWIRFSQKRDTRYECFVLILD